MTTEKTSDAEALWHRSAEPPNVSICSCPSCGGETFRFGLQWRHHGCYECDWDTQRGGQ